MKIFGYFTLTAILLLGLCGPVYAQDESPSDSEAPEASPAETPADQAQGSPAEGEQVGGEEVGDEKANGEKKKSDKDEGKDKSGQNEGDGVGGGGSLLQGPWFFIIIIGGFLLLYIWMGRSRRKQQAQRRQMLANLKKGDKVTTIGGIVGTIVDTTEEEVTIRVDDTSNTRMKFARWAIRGVGSGGGAEQGSQENQ